MATTLTDLRKTNSLQPALDFAEGQRPKPPQPRPRRYAVSADGWLGAVQSAVRGLLYLRFSSASSSVAPWLAISLSRHWHPYQLPSRQTVAANGRFMALLFH